MATLNEPVTFPELILHEGAGLPDINPPGAEDKKQLESPLGNPVPLRVTEVPLGPSVGEIKSTGEPGAVTVNVAVAVTPLDVPVTVIV